MDDNSSNVSDEELNKMIANLKNNQHSSPTKIISNSGSPVINGKGVLIGLAFDGNSEAMSGDIDFDSSSTDPE